LSSWEEHFLKGAKQRLRWKAPLFTAKQEAKLAEIRAKLHYEQQHVPLPPIDPDGLGETTDPDGWPATIDQQDEFAGVEDPEELLREFGRDLM
jgi:hypothetical protein